MAFYRQFVPRGGLCFDVGASYGSRTEVFLDLGARCVSVEPQAAVAEALRERFQGRPGFTLVNQALGASPGESAMFISSLHLLSSLSREWMEGCKSQPHLSVAQWHETTVRVNTLDALIGEHGTPDFIKIDVEGFEYSVLEGLSRPVPALSFEYTPWRPGPALDCVHLLAALGADAFNISSAEDMSLRHERWLTVPEIREFCRRGIERESSYGDIYARCA
jgi:FkbM family methyltransferase